MKTKLSNVQRERNHKNQHLSKVKPKLNLVSIDPRISMLSKERVIILLNRNQLQRVYIKAPKLQQ